MLLLPDSYLRLGPLSKVKLANWPYSTHWGHTTVPFFQKRDSRVSPKGPRNVYKNICLALLLTFSPPLTDTTIEVKYQYG